MPVVKFPYGKTTLSADLPDGTAVLESKLALYDPQKSGEQLVREALLSPVGSPRLRELAKGKKKVVIIASDHTRPVPSKLIIPAMLDEIRAGEPDAEIALLIATGCHRGTTAAELEEKFGAEIAARERIVVHDCDDRKNLVSLGRLPSGGECLINRTAAEADLLLAEGFIEPHFFAGFSGGRKSVLPGIAARETVLANHCSEFIAHPRARTGVLDGNPIHRDMLWAAEAAGLKFIVNVVLDPHKKVIRAVAGAPFEAHRAGCAFLTEYCGVSAEPADAVISTNGGWPLDQNVYQAVKGMTAAENAVKQGGVIIMLAASNDGVGGDGFYHQLADEPDTKKTAALFMSRRRDQTEPDQWQTQIFIRVLEKARVIFISEMDDETVRKLHLIPAHSIKEALEKAGDLLKKEKFTLTAIPDGVSVIVK